jgi:membrane peptidoglycan carboxypeptidase
LEKTATRKIKEIVLALELERRYEKDQILEFYLNQVPFGSNTYGVEAASQTYFDKTTKDLSLAEAAILASLINGPSRLSPYGNNLKDLLARKDYVLGRMAQENYITQEEAQKAKEEIIKFSTVQQQIKAPHFVLYVKQYLEENYSDYFLKEKGLKVYTSLDWELQQEAEKIIKDSVELRNRGLGAYNAALVALNPNNGEILAMVGSADWNATSSLPEGCSPGLNCLFEPKVNVAVFGEGRQPGSAFKPFAYANAFEMGYTPETILWDTLTEFNPECDETGTQEKDENGMDCYHPFNYDGNFRGPMSLRNALAQSINVPSVKLLYLAGVQETISLAKSFGITTLNQDLSWYGLSLVLGGGEVKLLDMTSAYGVFATRGYGVPPVSILRIEDNEGNIIEENTRSKKRVLSSQTADQINDVLSDNVARTPIFGANSWLYVPGYQTAVKTGTTQGYKDAWTIGYSSNVVVGVWAGNNDGTPADKRPGADLAGPIWHNFILEAMAKYPPQDFIKPEVVTTQKPVVNGVVDWQNPHEILYYINKDDPLGDAPTNPSQDSQYEHWEAALQKWIKEN